MSAEEQLYHIARQWIACLITLFVASSCLWAIAADQPPVPTMARSWVDLERYSGRANSSLSTVADFKQMAYELEAFRATHTTTGMSAAQRAPYETVSISRNNLRNRVPLSLIHWDRSIPGTLTAQQIKALENGITPELVATNYSVFALSPVRSTTYRGADLKLVIDQDDLFEEIVSLDKAIVSLKVNAGDDNVWREVEIGDDLQVSYSTTGTKTIQMEATLADGSVLSASAPIIVAALSTPDPTETVQLYGGQLYIYKSGPHDGLRLPVFVVEGFDMDNDMDWDVLYALLNRTQLAETLKTYGRDLIVLDFADAMQDIMRSNAYVAMDAIKYINSNRFDMDDKFTVIGASMGGLVTRFALTLMDKYPSSYGQSHVNTWISFDSPQEGANLPISLQELFKFFGDVSKKDSAYSALAIAENYRIKVDSPAAQQMLMCHHLSTAALAAPSPNYSSFYSDLRAYGYPSTCKKITIANGSHSGWKQDFLPGEQVFKWKYRDYWYVDIDADLYALKKSPATPSSVFYGRFNPFDLLFNSTDYIKTVPKYYPYALDNASGGTRASFLDLYTNLPSAFLGTGSYCNYPSHCFIPTTSALGIQRQYLERSIDSSPAIAALSPFDEIHCSYWNEPHIDINYNNKRWFMRAVLEDYDTDSDGYDDYQEFLIGTDYNSSASKLELTTSSIEILSLGYGLNLKCSWYPNVLYKTYFTESLTDDWTLIDTAYWYKDWANNLARCQLPITTTTGFYKIAVEIKDPADD